jgi:hypothetical protein
MSYRRTAALTAIVFAVSGYTLLTAQSAYAADTSSRAAVVRATGTEDVLQQAATDADSAAITSTAADGARMAVDVPRSGAGPVAFRVNGAPMVSLTLPATAARTTAREDHGTIFYAGTDADFAVQPTTDGGARTLAVLKNANAPTEYRYRLSLPAGSHLVPDNGGYVLRYEGAGLVLDLGAIQAPWARDAKSRVVPTSYRLEGNTLIQSVRTGPRTAYPVVADPRWTWGRISGTVYFNRPETRRISWGGGTAEQVIALIPAPWWVKVALTAAVRYLALKAGQAYAARGCLKVKIGLSRHIGASTYWYHRSYPQNYCTGR